MDLVHYHLPGVGVRTVPERDVGQYLRSAADNRRGRVHAAVACHHADFIWPEDVAEREELLRHKRLDRGGVEGPLIPGERGEVRTGRDQALARPGWRGQDDVRAGDDLDQRFLLVRVQAEALPCGPVGKSGKYLVWLGAVRQLIGECHVLSMVPASGD